MFNKNKEVFSLNCSYLYSSIFLGTLHNHLQRHGIDYLQFSFRWMNNLLTREIPLRCSIRLWDTYLAESDSFASFQLYVCAAFLLHWRQDLLLERDFQVSLFSYSHSNKVESSVRYVLTNLEIFNEQTLISTFGYCIIFI